MPFMYDNIRKYILCCHTCQTQGGLDDKHTASYLRIPYDFRPMKYISMDIKEMPESPKGYKYVLYIVCDFSNYVIGIPLKSIRTENILDALFQHVIFKYGPPKQIVTDQGSQFTSKLTMDMCHAIGINIKIASPGNHGSLRVERYIQTISNNLKAVMNQERTMAWEKLVWGCCYAHNSFKQTILQGYCPYELVYLHAPPPLSELDIDPEPYRTLSVQEYIEGISEVFRTSKEVVITEKLRQQQAQLAREKRLQLDAHVYAKGDIVYFYAPRLTELQTNSRKFQANWIGPLVVKQIIDPTHVLLEDLHGKELSFLATVHTNLLKPCLLHLGKMQGNRLMTYKNKRELEHLLDEFPRAA